MKKLALIGTALLAALLIGTATLAQGPALPPGEYDLEAGQYVFNVPELVETPIPPTDTPVPPPTDTPVPGAHNDRDAHPPEDAEFVQHEHGGDPHAVDNIFGTDFYAWAGGEISYAWETPNENLLKHEGYRWSVQGPEGSGIGIFNAVDCVGILHRNNPDLDADNCINGWRILHHIVAGPIGALTRFHSNWTELLVCTPDGSQCGTVGVGGHGDTGCLFIDNVYIPLPSDPPGGCGPYPFKNHQSIGHNREGRVQWNYNEAEGSNQITRFVFDNADDFQGLDPSDPARVEFICPDFDCDNNHSEFRMRHVMFNRPGNLTDMIDGIADGLMNYEGFVNRKQEIVPACSPLGPDCIPFYMRDVPVGFAAMRYTGVSPKIFNDFDVSPPGEFWIEFPN